MKQRIAATVASLALAATAGVFVWETSHAPEPSREIPVLDVAPAPLSLVCGGGLELTSTPTMSVVDEDPQILARSWIVGVPADDSPVVLEAEGVTIRGNDIAFRAAEEAFSGTITTGAIESGSLDLTAGSLHTAHAGDSRGAAMNPCVRPSMDQWLVGSSAAVGTSNVLILTNPGVTPVTATIEALTGVGRKELAVASTHVLAPGETKRVVLDGSLDEQERIALHIVTDSGGVAATLQSTTLDGYTPMGVSFITSAVESTHQVLPGVAIRSEGASLRIANPSEDSAVVTVSTVTADGTQELPGASEITVPPLTVVDLSLAGVPDGVTSFVVESDLPVIAAAKSWLSNEDGARDNAWVSSRAAASSGSAVFGPLSARFVAVSSGQDASITLTPISEDGQVMDTIAVDVPAAGHAVVDLPEGSIAVTYRSTAPVSAGVLSTVGLSSGEGLDWVPLGSSERAGSSQRVVVR